MIPSSSSSLLACLRASSLSSARFLRCCSCCFKPSSPARGRSQRVIKSCNLGVQVGYLKVGVLKVAVCRCRGYKAAEHPHEVRKIFLCIVLRKRYSSVRYFDLPYSYLKLALRSRFMFCYVLCANTTYLPSLRLSSPSAAPPASGGLARVAEGFHGPRPLACLLPPAPTGSEMGVLPGRE